MTERAGGRFALGRFDGGQGPFAGIVVDERVTPVADLSIGSDASDSLMPLLADWHDAFAALSAAVSGGRTDGGTPFALLKPLAPIPDARQVFCTGANYAAHTKQMMLATRALPELQGLSDEDAARFADAHIERQKRESNPFIFMKPVTAISGPYDSVTIPDYAGKPDWEVELAIVIGAVTHRVTRGDAMAQVAGYMIANDMTSRDLVRRTDPGSIGSDWIAGKGAPGFLPTGPLFVPAQFVPDPYALRLQLRVNGVTRQDDVAGSMTFDIARQIEFLSRYARVLPGDILCTGTPAGNAIADGSFLKPGDVMEAEINGLGIQRVACVADAR